MTSVTRPRIVAVIPALNEAPSIERVVAGLRELDNAVGTQLDEIIVVDNGSSDATARLACQAGATVVHENRRGYGFACLAGVLAARVGDVIVLLDGDAADDPTDLPRVVAPLLCGEAELVVGSRTLGDAQPRSLSRRQRAGNRLAVRLITHLYGPRVTDLGPLRAIRRDDLLRLDPAEMTYGWSTEMVAKAARAGYRYREVPVRYRCRIGRSKVGGTLRGSLSAGACILLVVARYVRWTPQPGSARVHAALEIEDVR